MLNTKGEIMKKKCSCDTVNKELNPECKIHGEKRIIMDDNIKEALEVAYQYSQIDGGHHKAWAMDQMIRKLLKTEEAYNEWIENYCNEDGNPNAYEWDIGIAP